MYWSSNGHNCGGFTENLFVVNGTFVKLSPLFFSCGELMVAKTESSEDAAERFLLEQMLQILSAQWLVVC